MTLDANKSEAANCVDKALDAIRAGDKDKAKRLLGKAKKMDPTIDLTGILNRMSGSGDSEDRSYAHDDHYEEPSMRSRKPQKNTPTPPTTNGTVPAATAPSSSRAKSRSASRTPKLGVDYTKQQQEQVERIRHCKDYYEILGLSKGTSDADIKKGYRKLALQMHPDKCRAPHATEAFKALGNAYAVLSDAEKRKRYDLYGAEAINEPSPAHRRRRGDFFEYDYAHGFDSDFTPEEIFNMFFGGGFSSDSMRRRQRFQHQQQHHQHQHQQQDEQQGAYSPLIQLLPLISVLVLGLLAQLFVTDPVFSLHHNGKYSVKRITSELKVPYFVKADFEQSYRGRLKQIENQVEDDYIQQLRMTCYKEQNQRETLMYRARWTRDEQLLRRAEKMSMPSCDRLREIYAA